MSNTNASLFERGQAVIPGGVNSPVRAFGSVGGTPYFVERADGPFVYDVEGRRYIDYVQSYGPSILGHAHPDIIAAIRDAATGTSYGAPTENEVRIAEEMTSRVEGLEMMRLVSSGTEAAMSAIRLARGATGRSKILKFAGNYHGHTDSLLVAGGSGIAQQGLKGSEGVTAGAIEDTIVAPYNVVPEIDDSIAVVCVEPIAANMGLVAPAPGFLEGLREACDAAGAMLLFDEVITGFRLCRGGAAEWFGVQPDVWCFGKVIGGGLPMGAYGAARDHEQCGAARRRLSGRHAFGESARDGCWPGGLEHLTVEAYAALPNGPHASKRACRRRSTPPVSPPCSRGSARCWASSSPTLRRTISIRPRPLPTTASTHGSSMGCSTVASPSHQVPTRRFSLARPRRRGDRSHHRCLRRGRRNPLTRFFSAFWNHTPGFVRTSSGSAREIVELQ